jgi:hypothetical protein
MSRITWCVGLILGFGTFAWFLTTRTAQRSIDVSPAEELSTVESAMSEPAVLDQLVTTSSESRREVPAAVEPVPPSAPPAPNEPVDFEQKYVGRTRPELQMELTRVRETRLELQKKITAERAANGQFIRHYPTPGVPFSASEISKSEVDRLYPQPGQPFAFQMRGGGGRGYVEITGTPSGEYPAFDELQREELWLNQRVGTQSELKPPHQVPR